MRMLPVRLQVLCTQFGKVVRAKIYTSKKQATSACYGYVTMADTSAAEKAAASLHKTQYKGRTISVEKVDSDLRELLLGPPCRHKHMSLGYFDVTCELFEYSNNPVRLTFALPVGLTD